MERAHVRRWDVCMDRAPCARVPAWLHPCEGCSPRQDGQPAALRGWALPEPLGPCPGRTPWSLARGGRCGCLTGLAPPCPPPAGVSSGQPGSEVGDGQLCLASAGRAGVGLGWSWYRSKPSSGYRAAQTQPRSGSDGQACAGAWGGVPSPPPDPSQAPWASCVAPRAPGRALAWAEAAPVASLCCLRCADITNWVCTDSAGFAPGRAAEMRSLAPAAY